MFRKMLSLVGANHALMLAYRAEIYLWVLAHVLPFIMMSVWANAASSSPGSGTGNFSMSPVEYKRYFFAVFVVRQFTAAWMIYEFEYHVLEGRLSYLLLRPMNPLWNYVAAHLGEQLARFPFFLAMSVLFFVVCPDALGLPRVDSVLIGIIAIYSAFALRFAMQYCFAMLTFWFERASAIDTLSFLPYLFLSGLIIPLSDMPPGIDKWLRLTPFPYMIDFPASILTGKLLPSAAMVQGFAILFAWFAGLSLIGALLWKRGLFQYSGQGA